MTVEREVEAVAAMRKAPVQRRSADTIETILQASARILEEEGEARFTTNRIAERAGYSVGTLYQYFPDKHAILALLAAREREAAAERIRQAAQAADGMAMRGVVEALLSVIAGPGRATRMLILEAARGGRTLDADLLVEALADLVAAAFERAPGASPPTPASGYVLGRAVTGVIRSAVVEASPILDTPAFVDALARLLRGLLETAATGR